MSIYIKVSQIQGQFLVQKNGLSFYDSCGTPIYLYCSTFVLFAQGYRHLGMSMAVNYFLNNTSALLFLQKGCWLETFFHRAFRLFDKLRQSDFVKLQQKMGAAQPLEINQ